MLNEEEYFIADVNWSTGEVQRPMFSSMEDYLFYLRNAAPSGTLLETKPNGFNKSYEFHYKMFSRWARKPPKPKKIEGLLKRNVSKDVVKEVFLNKLVENWVQSSHPNFLLILDHYYISNVNLSSRFVTSALYKNKVIFISHGIKDIKKYFDFYSMKLEDEEKFLRNKSMEVLFAYSIFANFRICQ